MRLAAAEIGLQLHDGIAALAGQAAHRPDQHSLQAFGQVSAAEELDRIPVFSCAFAQMHLPQVGGELGLLIPAACHILVRRHDRPPGFQARGGRALDRQAGLFAPFAPRLFVEAHPQQFHLDLVDLVGLRCRDRCQQPAGRVQDAVGIVAGEALLVRPSCCDGRATRRRDPRSARPRVFRKTSFQVSHISFSSPAASHSETGLSVNMGSST